ncbi:Os03g0325200 [Oryza sativa Japonica Group]|uniref:Os03g0325200 protein n=1 Tax=Oryza sativa subsp. japonica TaxID=39947 RepID=C7J0A8_ORYSJ|nr:Os03g0325200 [Oryza sativa Japonica Group]|eukprot:NP_001173404.1 Os03g0325200 [Oryza sativa Japonica Group]
MVAFDRLEMLDPPRELWLKRSSHFVHAWQYDPSSSRMYILFVSALPSLYLGPDFVSTCLRQEKAIAANKSSLSMIPVTRSTEPETEGHLGIVNLRPIMSMLVYSVVAMGLLRPSTARQQFNAAVITRQVQQLQQEQQHQEQGGAESPKKAESTCPMKGEMVDDLEQPMDLVSQPGEVNAAMWAKAAPPLPVAEKADVAADEEV